MHATYIRVRSLYCSAIMLLYYAAVVLIEVPLKIVVLQFPRVLFHPSSNSPE